MKNTPQEIYLQVGEFIDETDDFNQLSEITWCEDKIHNQDLKYSLSPQWISVNDRLPDSKRQVIVHAPAHDIIGPVLIGQYFDDDNTWTVYHGFGSEMNQIVTHWMEIILPY